MIVIPWSPYLTVGGLSLAWHAIFGVLAVAAGVAVGVRLAAARIGFEAAYGTALQGVVVALIASRAFHVVDHISFYATDPLAALAVWDGGESVVGGVVGGLAGGVAYLVAHRQPVLPGLDGGSIGLPVGMAIGRIGDIVNGEHHATACSGVPWCVGYTAPDTLGQAGPVHPAVAYEMVADLAIVAVLVFVASRVAPVGRGTVFALFLILYGAARFAITFYRIDAPLWGGLALAQWTALGLGVFGLAALLRPMGRYSR